MDPVARAEGPTGDAGYERLSGQDSSFVMFERPSTPMHVAAVAVFESGPLARGRGVDADRIRAYVASRLDGLDHYRQRLEFAPVSGHPFWVDDAHFDLDYHVRHAALPAPGGDRELKQLAGRILSQALDRRRPLWEMWIVEGLQDGRFALITKVHHCMVDGSSGVGLMTRLFRPDADATIPEPRPWSPRPRPSPARLALDEIASRAAAPGAIWRVLEAWRAPEQALRVARDRAAAVGEALRSGLRLPSATPLERAIGPHRRVEWRVLDLAALKALRRRLGGTLNDLVLAIVAGSMRRFLMRRGEDLEGIDYRVVIPVDMRSLSGEVHGSNRVSAIFLSLPVAEPDPRARLEAVRKETERLKGSHAADGLDVFTRLLDRAGATWLTGLGVRLATRVQPYNQIVSNVRGPSMPLFVLGARLLELHPIPPLFERQGLGTAVMSYDGRVCWGLVADRDLAPDLALLGDDVEAALEELHGIASTPSGPARRRGTRTAISVAP